MFSKRRGLCQIAIALAAVALALTPDAVGNSTGPPRPYRQTLLAEAAGDSQNVAVALSHVQAITDNDGNLHILGLVSFTGPGPGEPGIRAALYDVSGAILRIEHGHLSFSFPPLPTDHYIVPFAITFRHPPPYASYRVWAVPFVLQGPPGAFPPPPFLTPPPLPIVSPTPPPPPTPTPTGAIGIREGLKSIEPYLVLVITYDALDPVDPWKLYDANEGSIGYFDLRTLETGKGYWVNVRRDCTLAYGGFSWRLNAGWNLIAWLG